MTEVTRPLPGPDDESRPPAGAPTAPRVNVTRLVAEAASKSGLLWIRLPDGATHPAWHVWHDDGDPRGRIALMTASFSLGQIVGPAFAGFAYDATGSLTLPSLVAAADCASALALGTATPTAAAAALTACALMRERRVICMGRTPDRDGIRFVGKSWRH